MNKQEFLNLIRPKSGFTDLFAVYLSWSGVGFISALIAGQLDHLSGVSYATYFTNAVNAAIGLRFWILISIIGLLLYCLSLPLVYLAQQTPQMIKTARRLRYFTYTFFLVAFDEGALMIGILLAHLFHISERADLLTSKSYLFTDASLPTILALIVANSFLWLLGESLYNRQDKSYSGLVSLAIKSPLKYSVPSYLIFTLVFILLVIDQS